MRIEVSDGSAMFESGTIGPTTSKEAFLESSIGSNSSLLQANGPYARYAFRPEMGVTASAQFRESRLESIYFGFALPDDSTENWTKEHEMLRKARHDEWLQAELGSPPYEYRWGKVVSDFDHKGCESEVLIIYKS